MRSHASPLRQTQETVGEGDRPSPKKEDGLPESDDSSDQLLHEAIENNIGGLDGLKAARGALVKLFGRIERLHEKVDEAFCGQPFLPDLPPDCPANRRRFNAYFSEHRKVTQLLGYAIELWSFACGLKKEDDWTPVLIADINRRALEAWRRSRLGEKALSAVEQG